MHRWGSKKHKRFISAFFLLFAVALCLSGCGDSTSTEWGSRDGGQLRAIVNDSLALVQSARTYFTETDHFIMGSERDEGFSHVGLHLVNYRTKQAPLWSDTVDADRGTTAQLSDSGVFGISESQLDLWKIGEKMRTKHITSWKGSCASDLRWNTERVRPWSEGKLLLLGAGISSSEDSCQYGLLDTLTGVVFLHRFQGDLAWLSKCGDINYLDGKIMCLLVKENSVFIIDGTIIIDSTNFKSDDFGTPYQVTWWGRYVAVNFLHPYDSDNPTMNNWQLVMKTGTSSFDAEYSVWRFIEPFYFYDEAGKDGFRYSGEDF